METQVQIQDGCDQRDVQLIDDNWPLIAAIAFEGFHMEGRGIVAANVCPDKTEFLYVAGKQCRCHGHLIDDYDPAIEVIVFVSRCEDRSEEFYTIKGALSPEAAFEQCKGFMSASRDTH